MEAGALVTIMESVIHGKMPITARQIVDVIMMEHVRVSEESRRLLAGWTADATRMRCASLGGEKLLATVKIAQVMVGAILEVALTPVQEGIWVQMGASIPNQGLIVPVNSKVPIGLGRNVLALAPRRIWATGAARRAEEGVAQPNVTVIVSVRRGRHKRGAPVIAPGDVIIMECAMIQMEKISTIVLMIAKTLPQAAVKTLAPLSGYQI